MAAEDFAVYVVGASVVLCWRRALAFSFLIFCGSLQGNAAPCCSGGSSFPSIILTDDHWNLRMTSTNTFVVGEARSDGKTIWRDDSTAEQVFSLAPSVVFKVGDYFQFGAKLPLQHRSVDSDSQWGMSDPGFDISYEPLPLYVYSPWRPRFFVLIGMSAPLGKSIYDDQANSLNSFGTGFWTPKLGIALVKNSGAWDSALNFESKFQLPAGFSSEDIEPGRIYSGSLAAGYSLSKYRLGLGVGSSYEEQKLFTRSQIFGPVKWVWDAMAEFSAALSERYSLSLSYSDQTLIGPAKNISLERKVAFSFVIHGI